MSCYLVTMQQGHKVAAAVNSAKEFRALRDSAENRENLALARGGDKTAKVKLVQFNYNSHHPSGMLAGESLYSRSFGMDYDDPATREEFIQRCLDKSHEIGLLMLERSVSGAHAVCGRRPGETILEAQYRVSQTLDMEFDNQTKDLNRVYFASSGSNDDLPFLSDALFCNDYIEEEARRETEELERRIREHREKVPEELLKANKHAGSCPSSIVIQRSETTKNLSSCNESSREILPPSGRLDDIKDDKEDNSLISKNNPDLDTREQNLIESTFRLCDYDVETIQEGVRDSALFAVCMKLRHVYDFNQQKLLQVLHPRYTFGLPLSQVESTIRSAVNHERGTMPGDMKALYRSIYQEEESCPDKTSDELSLLLTSSYPTLEECIAEETQMPRLPKTLDLILKAAPHGYKRQVLCAVTPALCTLLTDVTMKNGSKPVKRMNAWSHLDGMPASNKKVMVQPIQELLYDIKQQDDRNQEIINQIAERNKQNKNKEEQEAIPHLPIRLMPPNTTRKKHILCMKDCAGKHTYTMAEELDSINGSGYYDRKDFERYQFDNAEVGTFTAVDDAQNVKACVAWNLTTSSTRDQTVRHWRSATDGSITRVWFELMPDNTYSETPQYYQYSEEEKLQIHRLSRVLMQMHGQLDTPMLNRVVDEWLSNERQECKEVDNAIRATLMKRSVEIAHTFGGVYFALDIAQKIMDKEDEFAALLTPLKERQAALSKETSEAAQAELKQVEQEIIELEKEQAEFDAVKYDLSRYREPKNLRTWVPYIATSVLDNQESLWGKKMRQQLITSCQGQVQVKQSELDLGKLPTDFTLEDAAKIFPNKSKGALKKMCNRFCSVGILTRIGKHDKLTIYHRVNFGNQRVA